METNKHTDLFIMDHDRISREKLFHDQQALSRKHSFSSSSDYIFTDEQYLSHESWIRPAILKLGDLNKLKLLDLGCGHGMASVLFARKQAFVTALDVSNGYLEEARERSIANGVKVDFLAACGERLPFASNFFDRIWGNAVLHHLNLNYAFSEILRVLAPGGKAVFCEPVSFSCLTRWLRNIAGYWVEKKHSTDEEALSWSTLCDLKNLAPGLSWGGNQFLGGITRLFRFSWLNGLFDWVDNLLCKTFFVYNRLCRYAILEVVKQ